MRIAALGRQLNLSSSYTGQLVKKGMPATFKEADLAWRAANVRALSAEDDLYVTMTLILRSMQLKCWVFAEISCSCAFDA